MEKKTAIASSLLCGCALRTRRGARQPAARDSAPLHGLHHAPRACTGALASLCLAAGPPMGGEHQLVMSP